MNKSDFIKELANKTGYDETKCSAINDIVEDTFIIGKKNKEIMIEKFEKQLNVESTEAEKIYETVSGIIGSGIKSNFKVKGLFDLILKSISMAMGIAVIVLNILNQIDIKTSLIMIGIGLFCSGLYLFDDKD